MYNVREFVRWALTHVKPASVPSGAVLPLPIAECGTDPWHYLFGSHGHKTTRDFLEYRWREYYIKRMSRAQYDAYTAGWQPSDTATDCQGLLDAWLTHEQNTPTDINADLNYRSWCTDKGKIGEVDRPFVIGEAVFHSNGTSMTHIGWICGFMPDGDLLIVEARGIAYGVVVTRLSGRNFTHRGLMTAKFDYDAADEPQEDKPMEPIVLTKTSPMMTGEGIRLMQQALNALGYTDDAGSQLDEDGKCGACTMQAVQRFANAHTTIEAEIEEAVEFAPAFVLPLGKYTAMYFRTEDLPEE